MSENERGSAPGEILERFAANCEQIELEPDIKACALENYLNLNQSCALDNDAQAWLCCAVYSELQQAKMKDMLAVAVATRSKFEDEAEVADRVNVAQQLWAKNATNNCWNISLTHLLRSFNTSIMIFLRKMKYWNTLAEHSATFQQKIEDLERRFGITLLLLQHYKRAFQQLYIWPESTEQRCHYQALYEFGWLLFLIVRNELPHSIGLVSGFQLLVCTLELVYVNALEVRPSAVIRAQFAAVPLGWEDENEDFDCHSLLRYSALEQICALIPELPLQGVRSMKNAFFHKALLELFMDQRLLGNDTVMRDLIKDGMLEVNLAALNRSYGSFVADISEMDERLLLNYEAQWTTKSKSPRSCQAAPLDSVQRENFAQVLLRRLPKALPGYIRDSLGQEDANLLTNAQNTLRDMCLRFGKAAKQLTAEASKRRCLLASGLYYQLLDKLIEAELRSKPQLKIAQLLLQRSFNVSLIACCLQLALQIYDDPAPSDVLRFPWLLHCYGLDAYEFQKILELVVRHHDNLLTPSLVRHLRAIEAECLASLIWRKDAQLWRIYAGHIPSYRHVQAESDSGDNKENARAAPRAAAICLRKFYQLAAQRLNYLCAGLSLPQLDSAYSQIWHLLQHCISDHGVALLQQRHLDQLLLCSVYLFARRSRLRISFSQILQLYRRQSHAQRGVYRAVPLPGGRTADIIAFYNQFFVPRLATYVCSLNCQHCSLKEINIELGRRISPGHNIFVTPAAKTVLCSTSCDCEAERLKRCHSHSELSSAAKRPNIMRRRTTFE